MNDVIVKQVEMKRGKTLLLRRPRWYWRMRAYNGELLDTSEMYTTPDKRNQTALRLASQLEAKLVDLDDEV